MSRVVEGAEGLAFFVNVIFCWRSTGRDPGQFASSTASNASVGVVAGIRVLSREVYVWLAHGWSVDWGGGGDGEREDEGKAVGSLGWDMEF